MLTRPKLDCPTNNGIFLGYVRKAGDDYGEVARVCPITELNNINMVTGKKPSGSAPVIEQTIQFYSNILGTLKDEVADKHPRFPMKDAYDRARLEVAHVTIPTGTPPPGFRAADVMPPLDAPEVPSGDVLGQAADGDHADADVLEDEVDHLTPQEGGGEPCGRRGSW